MAYIFYENSLQKLCKSNEFYIFTLKFYKIDTLKGCLREIHSLHNIVKTWLARHVSTTVGCVVLQ